ncbi:MAG: DUF1573 domain-containing protein [Chitinophagaceae bacterium]|nr:DUF1573 domain-containing protein [Chitinophagaceae bacterium]
MKRRFFALFIIASFGFVGCISEEAPANDTALETANAAMADSSNFTSIQWIDSVKNLGRLMEGQKAEVTFRFKNTGNKPLVIASVNASCGCTVPEKPEKPIMPGGEGSIKAVFDSNGRQGNNHKTISVSANTLGTQSHTLEFDVEVVGKQEGPKAVNDASKGL